MNVPSHPRIMSDDEPEVECQPCEPEDEPPTAELPSSAAIGPGPVTDADMEKMPTVCIVIGMAGSGKTSLMQRINAYQHTKGEVPYIVNLDPAVGKLPYDANIDIQDTVNYKEVMREYQLGPNGGILTAANLFATRFDQVIGLCEKRAADIDHVFVDTPGQIEIFTWSASGAIVTESFASTFPTCVLFVVDTPRAQNPQAFMSNMLQAVSILYKTRLPMILVFNKIDVVRHEQMLGWMDDFEKFHEVVDADGSFASDLSRSMSLVLDEFYKHLKRAGVSAMSGEGMEELFDQVGRCRKEYLNEYWPELRKRKEALKAEDEKRRADALERMRKDLKAGGERVVLDMEKLKVNEAVVADEPTPPGSEL